jgi:glutathione S-transferase
MKLYYLPGACSLTIHIALEWTGRPYEAEKVERDALKAQPYLSINPMGAVPALTDGDFSLTQNVAILDYLAGQAPQAGLFGSSLQERAEAMRWLTFINSDLHRTFSLVFGPQRYLAGEAAQEELRASAAKMLRGHFTILDSRLDGRDYLAAARPTAADAYLFVVLRWAQAKGLDLSGLDNLPKFSARMQANPGVQAALKAEGLA